MAINPLSSYASQQINNPFVARGDEQARVNERDQDRQRERTETRPSGTEAAEAQRTETRNNGSAQGRAVETASTNAREDSAPPRGQGRGSLLDVTV